jgi:hypothetical protein
MGPIEIVLRNAPYRKTKYIFEPLLGITFDSEIEGYDFYNMYSWEVGFGIKKDTLITNKQGFKTRRDLRCLCSVSAMAAKNFIISVPNLLVKLIFFCFMSRVLGKMLSTKPRRLGAKQ